MPVVDDSSDLAAKLREVSINNEILVAVSNKNLAAPGFMLDITKELLLAPLSPLVSPEGPASSGGSDAKSVEADFEFFSPN